MRTGLRVPIDSGKLALLSETSAVYGSIIAFVSLRLSSKLDSSLGLRYKLGRDTHVQMERATVYVADPAAGGTMRRSAANMVTVVCVF